MSSPQALHQPGGTSAGDGSAGPEVLQHREVGCTGGGKEEEGARRSRQISLGI